MENHSHSSHPDSHESSPRSRDVDHENPHSLEEPPSKNCNNNNNNNYKVKFMCSYGGKILPRAHDNNLAYVGGDTKILAVDRSIKFSALMAKLSSLANADVCLKYQLPGDDLDALISVTNEEDLENMMVEYDRVCRASVKPARLRLILFPIRASPPTNFALNELKSGEQLFADALNPVQIPSLEGSMPPAPVSTMDPETLFGLDKGTAGSMAEKLLDSAPASTVLHNATKDSPAGSDDRQLIGEQVGSNADVQRQIQELQRLQLGNNVQILQRRSDEGNGRVHSTEHYTQENSEKVAPQPPSHAHANAHSAPFPVPVPVSVQAPPPPAAFLPERHVLTNGGYSMGVHHVTGTEQPVYLIQTPSGMFQATNLRPIAAPVGQTYYAVPRMVPAAEVYNAAPPASLAHSQPKYTEAYSGYFAGAPTAAPGAVVTPGIDERQGGGALNQEGKVVTSQVSSATV